MGRIYLQNDKYLMQTRSGDLKVAFDNQGLHGQELKDALQERRIDIHLDGWWEEDILSDLQDSGLIPVLPPLQKEVPQIIHWGSTPRFIYYLHVQADVVLEIDKKTILSTDDEWAPNRTFAISADTSLAAAQKIWESHPNYWRPSTDFVRVWVDGGFNRKGFYTVKPKNL